MAFQLSPGVNFSEVDLTNATAAVGTTEGAIAGVFRWGPTNERTLITSENQLVDVFGLPSTRYTDSTYTTTWSNAETFTTAANFLGYSDALYVVRTVSDTALASSVNNGQTGGSLRTLFEAKYPGLLGDSINVSWCGESTGFTGLQLTTNGSITLSTPTTGEIAGLASEADALTFKAGDRLKVTGIDQELVIKSVSAPTGSGAAGTQVSFNPDSAPTFTTVAAAEPTAITISGDVASFTTAAGTPGVTAGQFIQVVGAQGGSDSGSISGYDATNGNFYKVGTVGTNTYQVKNLDGTDVTGFTAGTFTDVDVKVVVSGVDSSGEIIVLDEEVGDIVAGTVLEFDSGSLAAIGGLSEDTLVYAVPVHPITGNAVDPAVGGAIALKLADTSAKATDSSNTDFIDLTALADTGTSLQSTLTKLTGFTRAFTLEARYTGLTTINGLAFSKLWGDSVNFDKAPSSGNYHVLVRDADGSITGTAGGIIESYEDVSLIPTAKNLDGSTNYLPDVLENKSKWIKLQTVNQGNFSVFGTQSSGTLLTGGDDGSDESSIPLGDLALGYDLFADASEVDISFVLQGKPRGVTDSTDYALANYIIDNVAEVRRDCVAFVSPPKSKTNATDIVAWGSSVTRSSYAVVDSGYKYQYDKYADVYRFVPLNGDIAGLCARTDDLRDPWFSPAGINRGNVKNVVKLNFNPNQAQRDLLYKNGINPVITQPGQGTILFGDKTYQGKASAFDRINVRRLFIVLEKTIATAAKSSLFEFNDEFTRAQFVNLVEPFLRDVQGRRGIYDFKVVCDESNNTGQVIDTNSFVGDIYVKPARSINFIQLNFVAVRTGVEFSEVVGAA